ncbi:MAG: hypothetical protein EXX96DRAFT_597566 [Benjaminiella poitrasii]|nr:MAG: hypothetical protein EXX96DRAFT_597566 [Benjaminiella poitrasii]
MFTKLDILETLNLTHSQLLDFLIDVQETYQDTPYHSFYHAVDIIVVLYYIIIHLEAKKYLTDMDISLLFMAAVCHDAGHTGYNNDFHVKLNTELAIRYHQTSVLESLSVDITFELFEKHHFRLNTQQLASIRKLILSTDMAFHYDLLTEATALEDVFSTVRSCTQQQSFACILLHAADISNTVRIWPISKQWSDLIVQEFFRQGDAEKTARLQVSPGMDRDLVTQPSISLKFGDFVARPYFEALADLLPRATIFLNHLEENREEWQKLKQSPLSTSITTYISYRHDQQKVSVPAGTVLLPVATHAAKSSFYNSKPMPIVRATSHSSLLLAVPQSSASSDLRRKSVDHVTKLDN